METNSQQQTPKPDLEQSQTQSQQATKGTQPKPLQGRALTPEEEGQVQETADYWRRVRNEAAVQGIDKAEESAKQLIGLTGALQALYIGIYAFSDVRKQLGELSIPFPVKFILFLLYFLPLLMWLISLFYATRFFVILKLHDNVNFDDLNPNAWQRLREAYETALADKVQRLQTLQRSLYGMIFSTAIVLILLGILIFLLPAPATGPTQIIILTPTPVTTSTPVPQSDGKKRIFGEEDGIRELPLIIDVFLKEGLMFIAFSDIFMAEPKLSVAQMVVADV